jgi:hypothetical protein
MTQVMFHGNRASSLTLHEGLCLTPGYYSAVSYTRYGAQDDRHFVHAVELDLDGLAVQEADGYDRDENLAAGDLHLRYSGDVLVFEDEDQDGQWHETYRLLTAAALARVTVTASEDLDA